MIEKPQNNQTIKPDPGAIVSPLYSIIAAPGSISKERIMRIVLKNDFHETEVKLNIRRNNVINPGQLKRAKKQLCGISTCQCGGYRGHQDFEYEEDCTSKGEVFLRIFNRV